ncbi:hypothetical protein E2C01_051137 [Portunus trituberculatus]|uniref:Uncharacterized protein n=1 Tax=Portunus trituberculatus TaxID=210409 RepID=A0A5B7GDZ1_PORTR|nr:hypothetical protein [Portunus trituberculatus]
MIIVILVTITQRVQLEPKTPRNTRVQQLILTSLPGRLTMVTLIHGADTTLGNSCGYYDGVDKQSQGGAAPDPSPLTRSSPSWECCDRCGGVGTGEAAWRERREAER